MKRIMILTAVVGALVVAGCGTDANQTFIRDFNAAQAPLARVLTDVSANADGSDAKAYQAQLDTLATGLDDAADRFRALEAPADAQSEFAAYLKEVDASSAVVRDVEKAVDRPEKLAKALQKLQDQMSRVDRAEQALKVAVDG
jgi:hypothetical protein